ncbi:MAG: hypothetical protein SAMD01599839_01280 [Rectinema sp.]
MKFSAFANIPVEPQGITLLRALGTDRQVAALLCRNDGYAVSRSTVRRWRRGEATIPEWALWQLRNLAIKRNDDSLQALLMRFGVDEDEYAQAAFDPKHRANWRRVRRDGKPMYSMMCMSY